MQGQSERKQRWDALQESAQKKVRTAGRTNTCTRAPPPAHLDAREREVQGRRADLRTRGYENQHRAPTEVSKSDLLASRLCVRVVKGADLEPEGRGFESRRCFCFGFVGHP